MADQGTEYEYLGNAAEMRIESDERGFELHFETDQGCYTMNIHGCAEELLEAVKGSIGEWLAEGQAARGTSVRVTEDDLDAYEPNDPKRVELQRVIDRGGWA